MRTHEVKEEMNLIWEAYVMGEPVKEEDHRGHGHDCKKVHPDQSHDEWKMSKETKKMNEGGMGNHWSQMPANQGLEDLKRAIEDLEPAGDVQELYKDALEAHIDAKVLNTIVDKAIDSGALSTQEAHFITSGAVGENDPSDVGHRGFDKPKQEGLDDEERDRLTNLGPVNDVPYKYKSKRHRGNKREAGIMDKMKGYQNPEQLRKQDQPKEEGGSFADSNPLPGAPRYGHDEPDENYPPEDENFFEPDERQYDKAVQFIDWLMNPSNQAAKKYLEAFRDPNANAMDLGREIYGNMSPELQREYDIDTLIDAIEDKLAEVGMRPKESNIEPFSQYFNEDDKDKDSQDKKPPVDPDSASKRHHARKSAERGEAAKKRRPKSHGSFDEPSFGKDYD